MAHQVDIDAVLLRIRQHVGTRRIRLMEFFKDFDGLRHYKVSKANFQRILNGTTINFLTIDEVEAICRRYVDEETGDICYKNFIDEVDLVFRTPGLEKDPLFEAPKTGEILPPRFTPTGTLGSQNLDDRVDYLLKRLRLLVNTRGVVIKYHYQPFDAIHHGTVTHSQFIRAFPFTFWSDEDKQAIADKYVCDAKGMMVNYQRLHDDVTSNTYAVVPENPTSLLTIRKDAKTWEQELMPVEKKLQALIVMSRVRVKEFFLDYDPLRSGFVTRHQARGVFDAQLGIKIPDADWEFLVEKYSRADGKFGWRQLCDEIDYAFCEPGLESDPNRRTNLPSAETTAPARRNHMLLNQQEEESITRLETDLRRFIYNSRKHLLPIFQDFDRTKRGHVTKSQFARALSILGFELTHLQVDTIALKYCDLGNHSEINYRWFLDVVDPKPSWAQSADGAGCAAAHETIRPENTYFNKRGTVVGQANSTLLHQSINSVKAFTPYEY